MQPEQLKKQQSDRDVGGFTIVPDKTRKPKLSQSAYRPDWMRHPILVDNSFEQTPVSQVTYLHPDIQQGLAKLDIHNLFPVQVAAIPLVLGQHKFHWTLPRDIAVCAATGSGKTLAYLLPCVQLLLQQQLANIVSDGPSCIIVLPVRDLAKQVHTVCSSLLAAIPNCRLRALLLNGEQSLARERRQLVVDAGGLAEIVICTPGRLADHLLNCSGLSLGSLQLLVIDEADRVMAEQKQDWYELLQRLLAARIASGRASVHSCLHASGNRLHKLLLSATLTHNAEVLQQFRLHNPLLISAGSEQQPADAGRSVPELDRAVEVSATPGQLKEYFVELKEAQKPLLIVHLLTSGKVERVLCFTNSRESAHRLASLLGHFNQPEVTCYAISARLPVAKRTRILKQFAAGSIRLLVCSDSMARGIDLPSVDCVVCYDRPASLRTYIHRSGRTARAGRSGAAYTLLQRKEVHHFRQLLSSAGRRLREFRMHSSRTKKFIKLYQIALNKLHDDKKRAGNEKKEEQEDEEANGKDVGDEDAYSD